MKKISIFLLTVLAITILIFFPFMTFFSEATSQSNTSNNTNSLGVTYKTYIQGSGWQDYAQDGETSGTTGQNLGIEAINIDLVNAEEDLNIKYQVHVQDDGWLSWVQNGEEAGEAGEGKKIEAIRICLDTTEDYDITYRVHVQDYGWLSWVSNGEVAGTTGECKKIEAIEIKIEEVSMHVNYESHVRNIGWQDYVQDGETSGTTGQNLSIEAIKIELVNVPEDLNIQYKVHVRNIGWQDWVQNGEPAGTTGKALCLEAIRINIVDSDDYTIMYRVHVQNEGWLSWVTDGELAGTTGKALGIEAIQIKIVEKQKKGSLNIDYPTVGAEYYSDTETINVKGWKMANVSNSYIKAYIDDEEIDSSEITYYNRADVTSAILDYGTVSQNTNAGFKFTLNYEELDEGTHTVKIELYAGGELITTNYSNFTVDSTNLHVSYNSYVQDSGWQNAVIDGETSGTTGQNLRVEGIQISLKNAPSDAKIIYKAHVENVGWQEWVEDGKIAGVTGQNLKIEAIQIELENMADYTVEYRVHIQDIGWTDWYIDGETAGTVGQNKRIEAIQIRIVDNYKRSYQGIDVSKYQKEINYSELASSGEVEFIIARVGYYKGSTSTFVIDEYFERNYEQSHKYDIPLGAYIYSYATSVEEAETEAKELVAYLESSGCTEFDLPIYYDVEDPSQTSLEKKTITKMIIAFCDIVSDAGYEVGVYSYVNFYSDYVDLSQISSDYSLWGAHFVSSTGSLPSDIYKYSGSYDIWQYTSSGTISGITGDVDKDISYKKFN